MKIKKNQWLCFFLSVVVGSSSFTDFFKDTRHLQASRLNLKSSCRSRSSHTSIDPSAHPGRTRTKTHTKTEIYCYYFTHTHTYTLSCNITNHWIAANTFPNAHQPVLVYRVRVCRSWGGRIWSVCLLVSAGTWLSCPRLSAAPRDRAPLESRQVGEGLTELC